MVDSKDKPVYFREVLKSYKERQKEASLKSHHKRGKKKEAEPVKKEAEAEESSYMSELSSNLSFQFARKKSR